MNRKLFRAVSAAMLAVPGTVAALGLGPIDVKSALDQPLYAEIPILSASVSELQQLSAGLAPPDLFDRLGLEHPPVLSGVDVRVVGVDGGAPHIVVTSRGAMREPLLNLVVDVRWPGGRLLRDFAVLLDPPNLARRTGTRQTAVTATGFTPSQPMPGFNGDSYRVANGDTLWRIATAARPDTSVTVQQMVMALFRANPEAFFAPNINSLNAGAKLRIPTRDEIQAMGRAEALAEVRRQLGLSSPSQVAAAETTSDEPKAAPLALEPESVAQPPSLRLVDAESVGATAAATTADKPVSQIDVPGSESPGADPLIRLEGGGVGLQLVGMDELEARLPGLVGVEDVALAAREVGESVDAALAATQAADATVGDPVVEPPMEGTEPVAAVPLETAAAPANDDLDAAAQSATVEATTRAAGSSLTAQEAAAASESPVGDTAATSPVGAEEEAESSAVVSAAAAPSADTTAAPATPAPDTATEANQGALAKISGWLQNTRDGLMQDPRQLAIGGGALLVLALAVLAALRRRKGRAGDHEQPAPASAVATTRAAAPMAPPVREQSQSVPAEAEQGPETPAPAVPAAGPGVVHARARVDNVKHADFLMAMGQYGDAADLLREGLEEEPERDALRLKLLECFRESDDAEEFRALAESDRKRLTASGLWSQVEQLAQGFALLCTQPVTEVSLASSTAHADLDDELDLGEISDALAANSATDPEELVSDEELDRTVEAELRKLEEQSLTEDQDADVISFEEFQWQRAAGGAAASSTQQAPAAATQQVSDSWEMSTAASEDEGSSNFNEEEQSFVETKLDLARAYLEMGDDAGARTLFEEVLEEGNHGQRETAQQALVRLG